VRLANKRWNVEDEWREQQRGEMLTYINNYVRNNYVTKVEKKKKRNFIDTLKL